MPGADMGIDLGTSNTLIYLAGKGIVLNEPSVIAVDVERDVPIAYGTEAKRMLNRTSGRVRVSSPLKQGVISDCDYAQRMLLEYIRRVAYNPIFNPRMVICMPGEITDVERSALVTAAKTSGARKVCLLEESVAAAIGAGKNITQAHGCAVVDIGGGTTDMAVISLGGIAASSSIKIAGNSMDEEIIKYMRAQHHLIIGERMAEQTKIAVGAVAEPETDYSFRVQGRSTLNGLPRAVEVTASEMAYVLFPIALKISHEIQLLLEKTPPEMISDIYEDGILLTGGGAQIYGFAQMIGEQVKTTVTVAENPQECVARGAGMALSYLDQMQDARSLATNPLLEG